MAAPTTTHGRMMPDVDHDLSYPHCADSDSIRKLHELYSEQEGWKLKAEQHGVTVFTKKMPGTPILCFRGRSEFRGISAFQVFDLVSSLKSRHLWAQDVFLGGEIVESVTKDCQIWYAQFKCPWPISNRDTLLLHQTHLHPNGTYTCTSSSAIHPRYPEHRKFIRAEVYPSGFVVEPLGPDGAHGCVVYHVMMTDPRGWIPKWAVNLNACSILTNAMKQMRELLQALPPGELAPPYSGPEFPLVR
eukprot:gnl/Spiro4/10446_TR5589_c0_g1_i1.p1 gnl/Spiro4/10446_TR5589_c0_g1~~gnl/Spiro4/10446_TR5589_c0_g1_i1.p1  ORF type:complete len:275 (+),score=62.76 gnl/Spiro4/10446_TR5589_c0_g1_i1:91-825(+)